MKFTELSEKFKYPTKYRTNMQALHDKLIDYGISHYHNTTRWKEAIIRIFNSITYNILIGDSVTYDWDDPQLERHCKLEKDIVLEDWFKEHSKYTALYIDYKDIQWDVDAVPVETALPSTPKVQKAVKPAPSTEPVKETPKEDLYLRAPLYPRYAINDPWLNVVVGAERFYMYKSLPIIPEKQNDVSCTTDVNKMTDRDLMKLYPNHLIHTRAASMYERIDGIDYDEDLGVIIPINGYSHDELRENMIKYPHFYQLTRVVDGEEISFYENIEIDGELYKTLEVWDSLPESKIIPKTSEFIKEYVIRRYLLECDNGVQHKYPLKGSLLPYITLFAPETYYIQNKCGDPVELAKQCVSARVDFFQSRNPYLARYKTALIKGIAYGTMDCPFKQYCRRTICDNSCPPLVEFSYLLERNKMSCNSSVFEISPKMLSDVSEWLTAAPNSYSVVISPDTIDMASRLIYAAICTHWKGNCLRCAVYHLNFSEYLDDVQHSWSVKEMPEAFEYEQIFIAKAKLLVISNIDYVKFGDFQAQTLLNLIHTRKTNGLQTIIVSPNLNTLVGSGPFFERMKTVLTGVIIK